MMNDYIIPTIINQSEVLKSNTYNINDESKPQMWLENPKDILSDNFLQILDFFYIPCVVCILFFKPKNFVERFAHIDLQTSDLVQTHAFNILTQGTNSTMSWYEKKNFNDGVWDRPLTKQKTPHLSYKVDDCNLKFSCQLPLNKLLLVNTSILHAINVSHESRLCISLRTGLVFPTWTDVTSHFSYIHDTISNF